MSQSPTGQSSARFPRTAFGEAGLAAHSAASTAPHLNDGDARAETGLALVSDELILAHAGEAVPAEWQHAVEHLTRALKIDARWVSDDCSPGLRSAGRRSADRWSADRRPSGLRPSGLIEKARRAVGASGAARQACFAPWRLSSPTSFQRGQDALAVHGAEWVASYMFDFGSALGVAQPPVDLMVMSPCPAVCASEDALIGSIPRMNVVANMLRAARSEGRKNLVVITREAARATLATRLLGFDASLNEASLDVEFLSIEEAAVQIQRGAPDWDAVIAMPDLRAIVLAMLAQATGVTGPCPMLWHDRDLRLVSGESVSGIGAPTKLDATLLMQSLALLARQSGRLYAAERLCQSWSAIRDSGVVTAQRSSSAPYVNEIDDAAFIDLVTSHRTPNTRALPIWKGVARQKDDERKPPRSAQLTLVPSP